VSLKEGPVREIRLRPVLIDFLGNLLTDDKFSEFTSSKKYGALVSGLVKFHSNVPAIGKYVYHALVRAIRKLNHDYKDLAQLYSTSQNNRGLEIINNLRQKSSFADRKLVGILRLHERVKGKIF
jgi:hypothetical protein